MKSPASSGRFVVDLSGAGLDDDTLSSIESSVNSAVLQSLVGVGLRKEFAIKIPLEWRGIIIHPDIFQIPDLDKEISERMRN